MKVIVEGEGEWEFPDDAADGEIAVAINRGQGLGPRGVPEFAGRPAGFEPQTRGPLLSALPARAPRPIPGLEATGFGAGAAPQNPFMNQPVGPPAGGSPTGVSLPPGPLPPAGRAALPPQVNPLREAMLARRQAAGGAPLASLGPQELQATGAAAQPIPQTQGPGVLEGAPQALGAGLVDVARSAASMPRVAARLGEGLADMVLGETAGAIARKLGEIAPQRIAGDFLEEKLMKPASDFYEGGEAARRDARDVPVGEKLKEPGWLLRQGLRQVPQLATSLGSAGAANAPKLARLAAPFVMEAGETARNLEEHEAQTGEKLGNLAFGGAVVGKGAVAAGLELAGAEAILGRLAKYAPAAIRRKLGTTATKLLSGSVGEGGTERAQNLVGNFAELMATEKPSMRDLFERAKTPEFWQALDEGGTESQVLGSLLGTAGSVGTAAGTVRRAGRIEDARRRSEAEATWRAEDPEGRRVVPPETIDAINEGVRALQNPETADEGLRRLKLQTEALDARLQGLREPGATRAPEAAAFDPEGRRVVPQETIGAINEGVRELVPQEAPARPGLLDDVLARTERPNVLGDVLGATRARDRAAQAAEQRFRAEADSAERQRIAETPGAALRLILGDDPVFQPRPPAQVQKPGQSQERRVGPTPLLDWIDSRGQEIDEDRRSLPPEEWSHDEARYFALTDGRTGLPNAQAYEIAARQSPDAYHVVLDVDGLKGINDVFGHEVGNEYLETVALVGRANGVRLFRYGGDEFTAVHTGDVESLRALMETFRTNLQKTPVLGAKKGPEGYPTHKGFSYGIGRSFAEADARAYEDKQSRKARGASGANLQNDPQPVGVGGSARPEAAPGEGNPAGVPPPVRRRGGTEPGGTPGAPPAGPASLPPPVAPAAAAAPRETAPAPPPSRPALVPTGREGEAFTAGGERVGVKWAVVDAFDDLIPSHEETGTGDLEENPAFARELQPRDRSRAASAQQIESIAKDLRPGALGESYYATDGAPIVGQDRIVESGNGRTLAVRRAYRTGRAESYRKWVEEHAADFGLTPEQARGMKAPMLVRVRTTPAADRAELAKQMNVPTVARMSAAEAGRADADRLTPQLLARFQPSDDGLALLAARNRDFVAGFLETVPENERSELLDEDGQLSKAGITRIQNALLGKAYGNAPVLERITESTDDNTKLVSTALLNAAPAMAGLKGEIEAGNVRRDVDPTDAIVEAVQKLSSLRETGGTVESYLQQTGLFGEEMTPAGRGILEAFDKFKRSGKKLTAFLTELVDGATLEGDARQQGLFADDTPARLEDVVGAARRRAADGDQGDLFAGGEGVPPPRGDGAGTRGVPDGGAPGPVGGGRRSARVGTAPPPVADTRHVLLVQRWTTQLSERWKGAPEIRVVSSEEELPEGVRSRAAEAGATGTIEGLYTGPEEDLVYVVAPMVKSKADAERIVLHEVMGHAGLHRVLGDDRFKATMREIADSLPKDLEAKAREYKFNLEDADQRLEAAEEVLAEWASRPEAPPRAITRALITIRGWLRRIFPNLKWTPDDVRELLARARRRVEEGGGERATGEDARFARAIARAAEGLESVGPGMRRYLRYSAELAEAQARGDRENAKKLIRLVAVAGRFAAREWEAKLASDVGNARAASFTHSESPTERAILSRDVVEPGKWRVTRIDDRGPSGHMVFDTKEAAIRNLAGTAPMALYRVGEMRPSDIRFSRAQESTPEFKRWFGDSKVVDEQGRPRVVYHGTSGDFSEFSSGTSGRHSGNNGAFGEGFYFSFSPDVARNYADSAPVGKGRVIDAYLAIKSPFRVPAGGSRAVQEIAGLKLPSDVAARLRDAKRGYEREGYPEDEADVIATVFGGGGRFSEILRANGFDGVFTEANEVVAFRPEQIRFSRAPSAAEERVYQRLKENARRKAQEAREAAQRVLDEVADPGDILEARRDETLPEHSSAFQRKLVPAGRKEDVEPLLKPVEALYQKAVRRHYAVEKTSARIGADKGPAHLDPGVVAELSAGHAARAEQFIEGKGGFRLTDQGGIEWTGNRSLAEILKPLGKGRLNELRRYLVARRVIELHARKASTGEGDMFPDVAEDRSILSGISEAAARSEVAGAPEDVKQAAEEITALLDDALQYWAEAGGLSPEAVRVIREMNRAYVPFYRIFEGHDPAAKAGKLVLPAERGKALQAEQAVKRLVGSSRDILDPLVSTVDHIQRMIRAADLNRVGKTLVEAAAKNPDGAVGLVERVPTTGEAKATKEGDAIQKVAAAYDVEVTDEAAEAIDALSDRKLWFDNDRIRVWRNGKLEEYRVERSLAESLRALGPQDADVFQKLFTFPSTLLRGGVTKVPLFAWFNFGRDTGDAAVQSRNGFVPLVDSEIGLAEAIRNGDLRKEWLAAGGGYATLAAGGVKGAESALRSIAPRTKAGTVIKTLRHPLEALSLLNRPFEEAARLGEYRRAKMAGKSATEAALDAARVTTNFTVHGSSAFLWGILKASAFSNPALQGTDKAFRTVFEAPRGQKQTPRLAAKAAVNVLFKGLLYVGGLSVLFGLLGDDDDEIKGQRRTKAGAAWWFARVPGSEVIVRIPKPFLWGQLFGTGVEAALDRMRDENPVAFQEWRTQVLEMITDGAVPIPTPVKVGFELATNKSLFYKRPIVPRGLEGVEGRYQYGPRTSETAKAAGRLTGLSPAKLEYATGQIGGTLGREALRVGDTLLGKGGDVEKPASRLGDLPLVGRAFASTPATSSDSIETFYDELKDVRAAVDTARHLKKTDPEEWERRRPELRRKILLSRRYESVADQIGDIRKRIYKLEKRADLSADEKRNRIDGLIRRQTEIARRLVDRRLLEERER